MVTPMIRMGNGIEVLGEKEYHFDAETIGSSGIFCISHAHSDHLPKKVIGRQVVCSDITQRCFNVRTKKNVERIECEEIEMLNAGHMAGSRMFLLDGDKRILFTGDLCPRDRFGTLGAKPVKTDVLIIESTYGKPQYVFPDSEEMAKIMKDWVEDTLSQGHPVAMFAYPFGKSQDLLHILGDMDPYCDLSVFNATSTIGDDERKLNYRLYEEKDTDPFVIVCTTWFRKSGQAERWKKDGIRTAAVSGWALDSSYRYQMRVDEAFPFSDHADFDDLIGFVKGCDPSLVLTHHGFDKELAFEIRKRLGIDARPLVENQRSLMEF